MKIVTIFAPSLYAFHYEGNEDNEYDRLMDLWTDVSYLRSYAKQNKVLHIDDFINHILNCAENIDDF